MIAVAPQQITLLLNPRGTEWKWDTNDAITTDNTHKKKNNRILSLTTETESETLNAHTTRRNIFFGNLRHIQSPSSVHTANQSMEGTHNPGANVPVLNFLTQWNDLHFWFKCHDLPSYHHTVIYTFRMLPLFTLWLKFNVLHSYLKHNYLYFPHDTIRQGFMLLPWIAFLSKQCFTLLSSRSYLHLSMTYLFTLLVNCNDLRFCLHTMKYNLIYGNVLYSGYHTVISPFLMMWLFIHLPHRTVHSH